MCEIFVRTMFSRCTLTLSMNSEMQEEAVSCAITNYGAQVPHTSKLFIHHSTPSMLIQS